MKQYIQSILVLSLGIALAGCQEECIGLLEPLSMVVPEGEMAFCIGTEAVGGELLTRGMVPGEDYTAITSLQLLCFDKSGYYLGLRTAHPTPTSTTTGTFSGYVPENTARIHFVANANLDLSAFSVGTAEKVVMRSEELSTGWDDTDHTVCFWGYHKANTAAAMKDWLQHDVSEPASTVYLLRDRARIQLKITSTDVYSNGWTANSAGPGKQITSLYWGIQNGRERGYLAPYTPGSSPWEGYESSVVMNEYTDCGRYDLSSDKMDFFEPSEDNFQYLYDDSNMKTSSEKGRIRIVMKVTYVEGGTPKTKYLLALLREGPGTPSAPNANEGELVQITRNHTYVVNIENLAHEGYGSLEEAVDKSADNFVNAPADVDLTVPYISDGTHTLNLIEVTEGAGTENLIESKPVVVTRARNTGYTVKFTYTKDAGESAPDENDFVIEWEKNLFIGWTSNVDLDGEAGKDAIGSDLIISQQSGSTNTFEGTFTVNIGSIGESYAFLDYLVIRHKKSGLSRLIHFYAVKSFRFRRGPVLEQVLLPPTTTQSDSIPYMGPSADDPQRPVFRLRFTLSQSIQEDLFPLAVKLSSSTLEPYGDKTTSYTTRLSGGFGVLNAYTTDTANGTPLSSLTYPDGTALPSGTSVNHWNYKYGTWKYWYEDDVFEYPRTGDVRDGEVVIYLKDIRDAYAQASSQDVGLYLDIDNFPAYGLSIPADAIQYPLYRYEEEDFALNPEGNAGEYHVSNQANKYRAIITDCPSGTYTLSIEDTGYGTDWLTLRSTSVTADADEKLGFIFSVTANTATGSLERSAKVKFTSGSYTTWLTVRQDGASSLRLKLDGNTVKGDVTEVRVTVYSDYDWRLSTDRGGLRLSGNSGTLQSVSGAATGGIGTPVTLVMPVNYTTSDIIYTLTASNTQDNWTTTNESKTVTITQRKANLETKSVTFTAGTHFKSSNTQTLSGITGTLSSIATYGGYLIDRTIRWDFSDTHNTVGLVVTDTDSILGITKVSFEFHNALGTSYIPSQIGIMTSSDSEYTYGSVPSSYLMYWESESSDLGVSFDLVKGSDNIGLVNFTVDYIYVTWD